MLHTAKLPFFSKRDEDLARSQFLVKQQLKSFQALQEYQKTIEDRQKEQELVEELLKIVNERDRLEQRKLTYEVDKEDETEQFEKARDHVPDITVRKYAKQKDCSIM